MFKTAANMTSAEPSNVQPTRNIDDMTSLAVYSDVHQVTWSMIDTNNNASFSADVVTKSTDAVCCKFTTLLLFADRRSGWGRWVKRRKKGAH